MKWYTRLPPVFTDFMTSSTGLIPTEIGQLINLTDLDLRWNQLTGRWPKYEMVDQSTTGILIYQTDHQLRLCINDLLE